MSSVIREEPTCAVLRRRVPGARGLGGAAPRGVRWGTACAVYEGCMRCVCGAVCGVYVGCMRGVLGVCEGCMTGV